MRRLWILFVVVLVLSFSVLGWIGSRIYQAAPPVPDRVVTTDGRVVIDDGQIAKGQNVWQALGGMEVGSVWGHGSYVAPDWTADWLHREAIYVLDRWANEDFAKPFDDLSAEHQAQLRGRLTERMRTNTFDPETGTVTIDPIRADAFESNAVHYADVFSNGKTDYAIPAGAVTDEARLRALSAFFFWTSWAASTNRPDDHISYTHNWPYEPLVGNVPTGETVVWTGVSIIMLLAGISAMIWWYAARRADEPEPTIPDTDPLGKWQATPSQQATLKYFWVVTALMLVQMLLGVVTAHYGVEGDAFYGFPLSKWLPYSVTRTWHVQLGIFWIATAWLAAGLFIGPLVSEAEPQGQRLGVNVLFVALLVVVVGSLTGEWLSIQNKLTSDVQSFYFGHQGYEYVDLGRAWQIALLTGLFLWLFLMVRVLRPALRRGGEQKQLVALLLVSTTAIALFYGAGLGWGHHTHLSMVEYWRWWVVHLWVEGFFEVFATTVIAFFFMRLNLIRPGVAAAAALLSATIFLSGGIIGTCHHLYFSGTPTVALAWGSVFSALEVVPLVLVGFDAMEDLRRSRSVAVGASLQMAHLLLRGGGILEHGRRRAVWLHDQSADRSVLHARAEHDSAARARRPVWRLRNARDRPDAGLPARLDSRRRVERRTAAILVLVAQRRSVGHVRPEPAAGRPDANLGVRRARLLVRPQQRVPADAPHARPALDARPRRYPIRIRSRRPSPLRRRPENRPLVST